MARVLPPTGRKGVPKYTVVCVAASAAKITASQRSRFSHAPRLERWACCLSDHYPLFLELAARAAAWLIQSGQLQERPEHNRNGQLEQPAIEPKADQQDDGAARQAVKNGAGRRRRRMKHSIRLVFRATKATRKQRNRPWLALRRRCRSSNNRSFQWPHFHCSARWTVFLP